jgi:hypothetical protein
MVPLQEFFLKNPAISERSFVVGIFGRLSMK